MVICVNVYVAYYYYILLEYVDLYVDYEINKSVQRQFDAFFRGFKLVCDGDIFGWLGWQELELLICGSKDLDFDALQDSGAQKKILKNEKRNIHSYPIQYAAVMGWDGENGEVGGLLNLGVDFFCFFLCWCLLFAARNI